MATICHTDKLAVTRPEARSETDEIPLGNRHDAVAARLLAEPVSDYLSDYFL